MDYVHLEFGDATIILRTIESADATSPPSPNRTADSHYLFVSDVARHFEHARSAGAEIVIDLQTTPGLGEGYSCRDPGGYIWSFGVFDPWCVASGPAVTTPAADPPTALQSFPAAIVPNADPVPQPGPDTKFRFDAPMPMPKPIVRGRSSTARALLASTLAGGVLGALVVGTALYLTAPPSLETQIATEKLRREQSELAAVRAKEAVAGERAAKERFQSAAQLMQSELAVLQLEKSGLIEQVDLTKEKLDTTEQALQQARTAKSALEAQVAAADERREHAEQRVADEIEKAQAAAEQAKIERIALDAAMSQRVFTIEANFREAETKTREAVSARSKVETELETARQSREKAEQSLAGVIKELETERKARIAAEREATNLRTKFAAKPPAPRVAKHKGGTMVVKSRPRKMIAKRIPQPVAPSKRPVATNSVAVDDIWFTP